MIQEVKITNALAESLKQKNSYQTIEIEDRRGIFIGTTCGYYQNKLDMLFQSAEQDIVVYLKDKDSNYIFQESNFFKRFPKSLIDGKILIPLVIFEVKHEKIITHAVRQYSEIARAIKSIFPFCMYNFLLINIKMPQNRNSDRIYMAAKSFDKIIYKSNYSIGNKVHKELIEKMWKIIMQHIEYLKKEEYFRLGTFL